MALDSAPSNLVLTPSAPITVGMGETTDASSEFWQLLPSGKFIVYEQVPYALMQNLLQNSVPDTFIAQQLIGYPRRVQ